MTEDWFETARQNHKEFVKRAQEKGNFQSREEIQRFLALAIAGEAGELANFFKKQWRGDDIDKEDIAMELADIYTYVRHLCDYLDIDLEQAAKEKAEIVNQRLKSP